MEYVHVRQIIYSSKLSSLWTLNTFDNIQVIRSKIYQYFILQRAHFQCQNELKNVMVFNFRIFKVVCFPHNIHMIVIPIEVSSTMHDG